MDVHQGPLLQDQPLMARTKTMSTTYGYEKGNGPLKVSPYKINLLWLG